MSASNRLQFQSHDVFGRDLMTGAIQTLVDVLRESAVKRGDFVLSSGRRASYYVDVAEVSMRQPGFAAISVLVANSALRASCTTVGGPAIGALPLSLAAMVGFSQARDVIRRRTVLPTWIEDGLRFNAAAFTLRDGIKDHGAGGRIVGSIPADHPILLVDDVVSTGETLVEAAQYLAGEGHNVRQVFALVDRDKGASELFAQHSLPYEYVLTMADLGLEQEPKPPTRVMEEIATAHDRAWRPGAETSDVPRRRELPPGITEIPDPEG